MTPRKPIRTKHCEYCGDEFVIRNSLARYCAKKYQQKAWLGNKPKYMVAAQRRYIAKGDRQAQKQAYMAQYRVQPGARERANALRRLRYRQNPERVKAYVRAKRKGYVIGHTAAEWRELLGRYKHRCAYCGVAGKRLTKDHVIPISKGDPFTVDRIENIVPACRSCNSRKHVKAAPT